MSVFAASCAVIDDAQLAAQLSLPLVRHQNDQYDYYLYYCEQRLVLACFAQPQQKPLVVDFLQGKAAYRQQSGAGRGQLIARAVGLHKQPKLHIIDATAGLGRDAFVLAQLGAQVVMLERSPIIGALLADGLSRARQAEHLAHLSLQLIVSDAHTYLQSLTQYPDVIYLDPMFGERKKSALVKKEMRIIRTLVGEDHDAENLLSLALLRAHKRVVVKRARLDPDLGARAPTHRLVGKTVRYDVYCLN